MLPKKIYQQDVEYTRFRQQLIIELRLQLRLQLRLKLKLYLRFQLRQQLQLQLQLRLVQVVSGDVVLSLSNSSPLAFRCIMTCRPGTGVQQLVIPNTDTQSNQFGTSSHTIYMAGKLTNSRTWNQLAGEGFHSNHEKRTLRISKGSLYIHNMLVRGSLYYIHLLYILRVSINLPGLAGL